jgi:hypothetical protein
MSISFSMLFGLSDHVQDEDNEDKGSRKRTEAPKKTGNDRRKSRRVTAGEGLANMADSMETAMSTLAGSLARATGGTPSDPATLKAAAIKAIEKAERFSDQQFQDAVEVIMASAEAANMYLAITDPAKRTRFLISQLEKARL